MQLRFQPQESNQEDFGEKQIRKYSIYCGAKVSEGAVIIQVLLPTLTSVTSSAGSLRAHVLVRAFQGFTLPTLKLTVVT